MPEKKDCSGAFISIVTSLNQDILTPILGIFGGTDFSYLTVALGSGGGINAVGEKVRKKEEAAPTAKKCPYCLSEIAIEATRCPHCTSHVEGTAEDAAEMV